MTGDGSAGSEQGVGGERAAADLDVYCEQHPGSPSALLRPRLFARGHVWIALVGSTVEDGIAGIGETVESALRAFDVRYRNSVRRRA